MRYKIHANRKSLRELQKRLLNLLVVVLRSTQSITVTVISFPLKTHRNHNTSWKASAPHTTTFIASRWASSSLANIKSSMQTRVCVVLFYIFFVYKPFHVGSKGDETKTRRTSKQTTSSSQSRDARKKKKKMLPFLISCELLRVRSGERRNEARRIQCNLAVMFLRMY